MDEPDETPTVPEESAQRVRIESLEEWVDDADWLSPVKTYSEREQRARGSGPSTDRFCRQLASKMKVSLYVLKSYDI